MLNIIKEFKCSCGKIHNAGIGEILVENGAINSLPSFIKRFNAKSVFLVCDENTFKVGGEKAQKLLKNNGMLTGKRFKNLGNGEYTEVSDALS